MRTVTLVNLSDEPGLRAGAEVTCTLTLVHDGARRLGVRVEQRSTPNLSALPLMTDRWLPYFEQSLRMAVRDLLEEGGHVSYSRWGHYPLRFTAHSEGLPHEQTYLLSLAGAPLYDHDTGPFTWLAEAMLAVEQCRNPRHWHPEVVQQAAWDMIAAASYRWPDPRVDAPSLELLVQTFLEHRLACEKAPGAGVVVSGVCSQNVIAREPVEVLGRSLALFEHRYPRLFQSQTSFFMLVLRTSFSETVDGLMQDSTQIDFTPRAQLKHPALLGFAAQTPKSTFYPVAKNTLFWAIIGNSFPVPATLFSPEDEEGPAQRLRENKFPTERGERKPHPWMGDQPLPTLVVPDEPLSTLALGAPLFPPKKRDDED